MNKGLGVINTFLLVKTIGNQSHFISFDRTIELPFNLKYPLVGQQIHTGLTRDKSPSPICLQGTEFLAHSP